MTNYLDRVRYPDDLSDLERLGLIDISYSRLNTILDKSWGCELKYFFQYILKIPSDSNQYAVLGNAIHQALENTLENDKPLDEVTLFTQFELALKEFDPDGEIESNVVADGRVMLREYYERHKKDKYSSRISIHPKIIGKELPFEIVIGTGRIRGYIDLAYSFRDDVFVCDYKSGKNEVPQKHISTNTQLGIYALVMKKMFPDKNIHGSLYYLKSARNKSHTFSDEDLVYILDTLEQQISDLVNKNHFKPTSNERICNYCIYAKNEVCPTGKARIRKSR